MTHSAGFEEVGRDLFVADAQHMLQPRTISETACSGSHFSPGVVPAYSNYATALAGYIVERVSGKPFDQYVQDNILPRSTCRGPRFVQPLPENLKPLMSNGYKKGSDKAQGSNLSKPIPPAASPLPPRT